MAFFVDENGEFWVREGAGPPYTYWTDEAGAEGGDPEAVVAPSSGAIRSSINSPIRSAIGNPFENDGED
jgi:hypothetical protein